MDSEVKIKLDDPSLLRQQCYVDGRWVDAASGDVIEVDNPATGETIATVPSLSGDEVRGAIEAANASWAAWRKLTGKQRCNALREWYNLIMAAQEDLAEDPAVGQTLQTLSWSISLTRITMAY